MEEVRGVKQGGGERENQNYFDISLSFQEKLKKNNVYIVLCVKVMLSIPIFL